VKKKKPATEPIDWNKVFELRCRSKRGERLWPEEHNLIEKAYKANPKKYGAMEKAVFEATKPFGAR
jgi:hypothetical protein